MIPHYRETSNQTSRRFVSSSTVLCIAVCVCRQQGAQSAGYPDGAARAAQPQHLPVGRDPGQAQRPGREKLISARP